MASATNRLTADALTGSPAAFAKLLSFLEAEGPRAAFQIPELLNPINPAFRLGITGPPGAGKSTLVNLLVKNLREKNLKVGVIAVDPSSPFSGGAILGDRIRYVDHALDPNVFIRSLGTRGNLGGLSAAAYLMLRAFDACGFDVVLIETVGVGQTELDVLHVADQIAVVLVPESGDGIQAMKAGLMEIADVFLVNKADRPGADQLVREIQMSLEHGESAQSPSVFAVEAISENGLEPWYAFVSAQREKAIYKQNRFSARRLREEARALLRTEWENSISARLESVVNPETLAAIFKQAP